MTLISITMLYCRKPYLPPVIAGASNYLVVEGVINTGQDSTIIRLSRTVALSSSVIANPESHAIVTVESDANASYPLTETSSGYYSAPALNLSTPNKYRLKIITSDNRVYLSDFVPAKNSPPIDSVYYQVKTNGVQIYADTHDPLNSTTYYRWDFNETYIFHSAFYSYYYFTKVPFDTILPRSPANQIYTCWRTEPSTDIVLNSSAKLSNDVIKENQITFIPSTSEKIGNRYSILVKQYALTPDAFNYWQQLKKNTEQLGSIFDAQPSELPGNIHCLTNPLEPVLGYITAGGSSEMRIFIDNRNLPFWKVDNPYADCGMYPDLYANPVFPFGFENQVAEYIYTGLQIPLYPIKPPGSNIIKGYQASDAGCVDCTLRGTNKQPGFWINR